MYEDFHLYPNGELYAGGKVQNYTSYCIERHGKFEYGNHSSPAEAAASTDFASFPLKVAVCAPDDPFSQGWLEYMSLVDFTIVPILFVISLVFLGLLFVHVWINNRHKLFGVMTLCLIAMLFVFYLVLIIAKFTGGTLVEDHRGACIAVGLLLQFFYLSAIFWLSAMSFDIWSTFRHMRRVPDSGGQQGWKHKRFKWFALYSWGCPLLMVLVTIVMQFVEVDEDTNIVKPGMGDNR